MSTSPKVIQIAGGGLAGLALGILLRRRGIPVAVSEALQYPRHRVCGEFLSGRGQRILQDLGLDEGLPEAGVASATTMVVLYGKRAGAIVRLPSPAVCISRHTLDAGLARVFEAEGGELRVGERLPIDAREGLVRATGRRQADHPAKAQWVGLKVHARNVRLMADLEMHLVPSGYVGLCRLSPNEVNICGLFRLRGKGKLEDPHGLLRGPMGSQLHERLARSELVEKSCCAVSALDPWPRFRNDPGEFCVGDSLTMMPPITGNGMSLALESAVLAVASLADYSTGRLTWKEAIANATAVFQSAFKRRLRWAGLLQRAILAPALGPFIPVVAASPLINALFARTRDLR